jgi:hypothetical protein
MEVSNIYAFLDGTGTGLEIARPSNGVQNPFYNGYMNDHYLIFQGISFPDRMVVIEGAFPGYQPDTMIRRDSNMRQSWRQSWLSALRKEELDIRSMRTKYTVIVFLSPQHIVAEITEMDSSQDWQIRLNRF